jgi:hypothetical protein
MLELFVNLSLAKFFKAGLRGQIKASIALGLLSLVFFGCSFLLTTNGLAQRQAQKADNTGVIIDKYSIQVSELKKTAESDKNQLLQAIETIKQNPAGWRNGKRNTLELDQLASIDNYYSQIETINNSTKADIDKIEKQKGNELVLNTSNVESVASRFYKTSCGIMALQIFVNGLLMFFYSRIYAPKHQEQLAKDHVESFADRVTDLATKLIETNISSQYQNYMTALDLKMIEKRKKENDQQKENDKSIGFKNTNTDQNDTNDRYVSYDRVITNTDQNDKKKKTVSDETRICKQCGKLFHPYSIKHIFCTNTCKLNWHKDNRGFDLDIYKKIK